MKTPTKLAALLLGTALVAAAPPLEMLLSERDHKKIGELVQEYYQAVAEKEDIADAKAELGEEIVKLEEKFNKRRDDPVAFLEMTDDLRAIFTLAKEVDKRPPTGKVEEIEAPTFLPQPVKYAVHAPKGYKSSKGAVPLIIVIPDEGVEPARCLDDMWMLGEMRNEAVIACVEMPEDPGLWGASSNEPMGGLETVMFTLRDLNQKYLIDSDRVYLAGHGPGVAAAMDIGATFPYIFAGILGRSGDMGDTDPTNFRNLPTYFAGGGSNVSEFQAAARELEIDDMVTIDAEGRAEDAWSWIQSHPRNPNPEKISFAPTSQRGPSAYWIQVSGYDLELEEQPKITVTVDKEANRIDVESVGISTVTMWFNDAIVDLDREVVVVCNGEEYTDTFGRSLSTALEQYFRSNDPSRVYSAGQVYDLPEPDGN